MEAIIVRALTKIASDCSRRQTALRKRCRETLVLIQREQEARPDGAAPDTEANKYMPCLLEACRSGLPKVVATALDAIVKLIDYGYIRDVEVDDDEDDDEDEANDMPGSHMSKADGVSAVQSKTQTDASSVRPADGEGREKSTQERGTDESAEPVEPASPSSGAMQEASAASGRSGEGSGFRWTPQRMFMDEVVETVCDCDLETDEVQLQVIKALVHACTANTLAVHRASLLTAVKTIYTVHLSTHDPINKNTAKASLQQMLSVVFSRMELKDKELKEEAAAAAELEALRKSDPVKYPPPPLVEPEAEPQPEPDPDPIFVAPESMYPAVPESLGFEELYATVPELSAEERLARRKRYRRALRAYRRRRWEATTPQPFPSVAHEDAFLLFRALCKLSQRPDHAGPGDGLAVAPTAEEARQMESKAVSLEMLLSIVEGSGPGFRTGEKFILAVRHYLCEALLLNSTSSNRTVMGLSLKIFQPMCRDFKAHLKSQIEVFITTVFLRVLESENSTFEHKRRVLAVVKAFSDSPQALVEIFLSYDCDLHAIDLYNRIVNALSKISKGRVTNHMEVVSNPGLLREESYLRKKGLEGLVDILENMLRCVGSDDMADLHEASDELLDGARAEASVGDRGSDGTFDPLSAHGNGDDGNGASNGHVTDTLGSMIDQGEVGIKSPVAVVQEYDRKKKLAGDLINGVVRFNLSPSKGITYLVEKGMLQYEPRAVASFLLENCDKLDKTQIGEYLGKEISYKDGFCVQVLHEYVDMMDFKGMRFDDAIRHYLSGFRLPGEAQKIDRMMEKFSERFCLQNPTVFPSADTAFILAFSIIMLNTDLHNPAVKDERKMTKEAFAANNRGIAAGGNLEESFLNEIFDHIRANPISLKEDDYAREREIALQGGAVSGFPLYFATGPSIRQKREAFNKERETIIKETEALFRLRKKQASAAKAHAMAKAAEEAKESQGDSGSKPSSSKGDAGSTKAGEAKLQGAPPASVSVALRADSVSEGRRDVVRAMFEVAWWPMLGAFSQVLEDVDHLERLAATTEEQEEIEADMIALCVRGCRLGIRLGGLCARWSGGEGEGGIARETFVNTLAKFTLLDTVEEIRHKSIDCVRSLLDIALKDGNYLAESWGPVLRYMSQLARLQLFASGLHTDDHFFTSETEEGSSVGHATGSLSGGSSLLGGSIHSVPARRDSRSAGDMGISIGKRASKGGGLFSRVNVTEQARDVERMNAEIVAMAVDPAMIDRVFSNSAKLSTDAVQHFVTQLCAVSNMEINHSSAATFRSRDVLGDMSKPRIFSLQKLVEVADFNMDSRGRIVWANVWGVLSQHFSALGAHQNRSVAEFAVDSLKQLALKFVIKEELRDFNFQRLFLSPFESIFVTTQHKDIKVLVLDCLQNLVQARAAYIRSGWKSIFTVLSQAAKDMSSGFSLPRQAWQIVSRLVDDEMGSLVYDFLDVTKCLLAFVESSDMELSLQALERLGACANHLAKGDLQIVPPALHGHISTGQAASTDVMSADSKDGAGGQELMYLQLWWPLLFGLSEAMGSNRPEIRSSALEALSNILDNHGHIFSPQTWGLLFRGVVSPVFENAITDPSPPLSSEWPGQEQDPRELLQAAVTAIEEEEARQMAAREAEEEERAAQRAATAASPWGRLNNAIIAFGMGPGGGMGGSGGGGSSRSRGRPRSAASRGRINGLPVPTAAQRQTLAALKTGWTATMAEKLLELCFRVFFKYGEATLPLLPEMLGLHQRCICQESEVLARIALRSLGRFVTSMHKAFPDASPTIIRRQATAGGEDGSAANLQEEGKEEVYTIWDCLTASLCAIMADNLPLELLNNPFYIAPENGLAPVGESAATAAASAAASNSSQPASSSSPAWMEQPMTPVTNNEEVADISSEPAAVSNARPESESSWGELQDAGDVKDNDKDVEGAGKEGHEDGDEDDGGADEEHDVGDEDDGEAGGGDGGEDRVVEGKLDMAEDVPEPLEEAENGGAGFAEGGGDQHVVGGDAVMVSPLGQGSDDDDDEEEGRGEEEDQPAEKTDGNGQDGEAEDGPDGGATGVARRPNLGALMTMLVVSLRMQRLVHWVVRKRCLDGLSEENLVDLLSALEAASVTALQFNRHHNLRRALGRVGFMTRGHPVALCPMLEQEVAGYNLLLRTLVVLSCGMDVDTGEVVEGGAGWRFAQERLVQACKCVVLAYADREEHAMGLELSQPGLDHSSLVEEVKETTALVILALRSMMYISEEEVRKNLTWMYGSMARLVRCDSDAVRQQVHEILTHKMGPGLMSGANKASP